MKKSYLVTILALGSLAAFATAETPNTPSGATGTGTEVHGSGGDPGHGATTGNGGTVKVPEAAAIDPATGKPTVTGSGTGTDLHGGAGSTPASGLTTGQGGTGAGAATTTPAK